MRCETIIPVFGSSFSKKSFIFRHFPSDWHYHPEYEPRFRNIPHFIRKFKEIPGRSPPLPSNRKTHRAKSGAVFRAEEAWPLRGKAIRQMAFKKVRPSGPDLLCIVPGYSAACPRSIRLVFVNPTARGSVSGKLNRKPSVISVSASSVKITDASTIVSE